MLGEDDNLLDTELQTLKSIYLDELEVGYNDQDKPVFITVHLYPATAANKTEQFVKLSLLLQLSSQYPQDIPDIKIQNTRGLSDEEIESIHQSIHKVAIERKGNAMIFELVEVAKECLTKANIPSCQCAICLYGFMEEDILTKTECFHYFHSHCLANYVNHILQEPQEKVKSSSGQDKNTSKSKVVCPICRLSISFLPGDEIYPPPAESETNEVKISSEVKKIQKKMMELFNQQKEKGGIIDVEAEKNKFLLEISSMPDIATNINASNTEVSSIEQTSVRSADDTTVSHKTPLRKKNNSMNGSCSNYISKDSRHTKFSYNMKYTKPVNKFQQSSSKVEKSVENHENKENVGTDLSKISDDQNHSSNPSKPNGSIESKVCNHAKGSPKHKMQAKPFEHERLSGKDFNQCEQDYEEAIMTDEKSTTLEEYINQEMYPQNNEILTDTNQKKQNFVKEKCKECDFNEERSKIKSSEKDKALENRDLNHRESSNDFNLNGKDSEEMVDVDKCRIEGIFKNQELQIQCLDQSEFDKSKVDEELTINDKSKISEKPINQGKYNKGRTVEENTDKKFCTQNDDISTNANCRKQDFKSHYKINRYERNNFHRGYKSHNFNQKRNQTESGDKVDGQENQDSLQSELDSDKTSKETYHGQRRNFPNSYKTKDKYNNEDDIGRTSHDISHKEKQDRNYTNKFYDNKESSGKNRYDGTYNDRRNWYNEGNYNNRSNRNNNRYDQNYDRRDRYKQVYDNRNNNRNRYERYDGRSYDRWDRYGENSYEGRRNRYNENYNSTKNRERSKPDAYGDNSDEMYQLNQRHYLDNSELHSSDNLHQSKEGYKKRATNDKSNEINNTDLKSCTQNNEISTDDGKQDFKQELKKSHYRDQRFVRNSCGTSGSNDYSQDQSESASDRMSKDACHRPQKNFANRYNNADDNKRRNTFQKERYSNEKYKNDFYDRRSKYNEESSDFTNNRQRLKQNVHRDSNYEKYQQHLNRSDFGPKKIQRGAGRSSFRDDNFSHSPKHVTYYTRTFRKSYNRQDEDASTQSNSEHFERKEHPIKYNNRDNSTQPKSQNNEEIDMLNCPKEKKFQNEEFRDCGASENELPSTNRNDGNVIVAADR